MTTLTTQEYLKKIKEKKNKTPRNKYNASKTTRDSFTFHSKAEANYYDYLKDRQKKGEILYFLRQVAIHLPGNIKYLADFMVVYGTDFQHITAIEYIDVKGAMTQVCQNKIKTLEAIYPIKIKLEK